MLRKVFLKSFNVFFVLVIPFYSYPQISYKAGYILSSYYDIAPDTLINTSCTSSLNYLTESFYFDLNGDLQNDLEIVASCFIALGSQGNSIKVNALNSNSSVLFGRYDSVYNTASSYWMIDPVAKPLLYGDTINSSNAIWDSSLFLVDNYSASGSFILVTDWNNDTLDKYIGIKYQNVNDTVIGWIRVSFNNGCLIKDFSLSTFSNGITNLSANNLIIYPIPSSDKIYFKQSYFEKLELKIFDSMGKQMESSMFIFDSIYGLDVRSLDDGIYFVNISSSKRSLTKKIIVKKK